ncbi:MAG: PotD/PotF family extracellular solute-binding protein [Gaiellales bacterium]|jgi:spermidine/putrescine transport system substrate-binding protein
MTDEPQRQPLTPRILTPRGLTRRDLLRRAGIAGGVAAGGSLLAACGSSSSSGDTSAPSSQAAATIDKTVAPSWTFSNWPLYIDTENKTKHPSLDKFDKEYSTKTTYIEDIEDNESFFGQVKAQLEAGQNIKRDIVVLTDWMAGKWVKLGYASKLDTTLLPTVQANLLDDWKGRPIDPDDTHLVPWQSGFTGLAYNPKLTGGDLTTLDDLWNPDFKGKVTLLTEMRDTLGLTMSSMGVNPEECTIDDAQAAVDKLRPYVENGQVRRFTGNDYAGDLAKGNVVACMGWSGDIVQLQFDNPDLKFIIPASGGQLWTDNMIIPKGASAPYNAHLWMDFAYRPEVAAMIEDWVNYICPVKGAKEALIANDPAVAKNPLIFPTAEMLSNTFGFKNLEPQEELEFNKLFQDLVGA